MTVSGAILGLPTGVPGWKLLQKKKVADFKGFNNDAQLKNDIAYLRAKLPGKTTAKAMLADPRLQKIVLSAYGLDSQVGLNGLMEKVLNSDLTDSSSLASKMTNAAFKRITRDFNYGGTVTPAVPARASQTVLAVNGLGSGSTFGSFSGTLGGVKVSGLDLSGATDTLSLAARLQAAFRKADGNRADLSVTVNGGTLVFADRKGRGALTNTVLSPGGGPEAQFIANGLASATAKPAASQAQITVADLKPGQTIGNFSGSFAGIALNNVDLAAATSADQVAAALQAAFRAADNNAGDISVTAKNNVVTLRDAKARGGASDVSFATVKGGASARLTATSTDASGTLAAPTLPTPSTATVQLIGFDKYDGFKSFSGSFGGVTLSKVALGGITDAKTLASALQDAFRAADNNRADISVTASGNNTLVFTDSEGKGGAKNVNFASLSTAKASVTSAGSAWYSTPHTVATLAVSGLGAGNAFPSLAGSFAGVTIGAQDTSGITTLDALASTLQSAFQAADRGRPYITVGVNGGTLVFTDLMGRNAGAALQVGGASQANAHVVSAQAGSVEVPASGGPKVTDQAFIDKLVTKYTQAQFNKSVGSISGTLRQALYAQQTLPTVSNWYAVIADTNLAKVVETALNLPADSFGRVDVDQQVTILKNRMNVADFKDPAKLAKLLDKFVAMAAANDITGGADQTNGLAGMIQPLDLSGKPQDQATVSDAMIGATTSAIFSAIYSNNGEDGGSNGGSSGIALSLLSSAAAAYG